MKKQKKETTKSSKSNLMKTSQIISLMLTTAALGGSVGYYILHKEDLPFSKSDTDCMGSVAALPLVNVTTGMGMTTAIAECD